MCEAVPTARSRQMEEMRENRLPPRTEIGTETGGVRDKGTLMPRLYQAGGRSSTDGRYGYAPATKRLRDPFRGLHPPAKVGAHVHVGREDVPGQPMLQVLDVLVRNRPVLLKQPLLQGPGTGDQLFVLLLVLR